MHASNNPAINMPATWPASSKNLLLLTFLSPSGQTCVLLLQLYQSGGMYPPNSGHPEPQMIDSVTDTNTRKTDETARVVIIPKEWPFVVCSNALKLSYGVANSPSYVNFLIIHNCHRYHNRETNRAIPAHQSDN